MAPKAGGGGGVRAEGARRKIRYLQSWLRSGGHPTQEVHNLKSQPQVHCFVTRKNGWRWKVWGRRAEVPGAGEDAQTKTGTSSGARQLWDRVWLGQQWSEVGTKNPSRTAKVGWPRAPRPRVVAHNVYRLQTLEFFKALKSFSKSWTLTWWEGLLH